MKHIRIYIALGILCSLEIILTRFVQIPVTLFGTFTDRITVGFLPIMIAGALFGPLAGGIAGGVSDVLRALIFPQGAFNPLFTVSAILRGVIYGMFLRGKISWFKILLASFIIYVLVNNIITNYFISISYGNPFYAVMTGRIFTTSFNFIVQSILGIVIVLPLERKLDYVRKWRI